MTLTREQILKADDLPVIKLAVPEWGGDVYIRTMSGKTRDTLEATISAIKDPIKRLLNGRAKYAAAALSDEQGNLLFDIDKPEDISLLTNKAGSALDKIFEAVMTHNKISEEDFEETVKNSQSAQN